MTEKQESPLLSKLSGSLQSSSILRPWSKLMETGLSMMGATMQTMQSAIGRLAGQEPPRAPTEPPLDGPRDIDAATVEFVNRLALLARVTPPNARSLVGAGREILNAGAKSFGSVEPKDLRQWIALALELPLSFGTLFVEQGLRGLHAAQVVGLEDLPDLVSFAVESFTDLDIFTGLQYKQHLTRLESEVRESPNDAGARMKLGIMYIKLGRYPEATRELHLAAGRPSLRAAALCHSLIANVRAGDYRQAVKDGAASLAEDPSSDRARFWTWLAAQRLGGYPDDVPHNLRMEVKAGRHPSRVQFEEVSRQIGLDKTSGGRGSAICDLDGDGYLDVIIACANAGCSVYRNNGDGTFRDATVGSGLEDCVNTHAVIVGDYNNDGWDDVYVTRLGFYAGDSVLLRNNGDGTFTDVTKESGLLSWGPVFGAEWVDYDCDGNLDLFVTHNQGRLMERKSPNLLFHNNGDGTFSEVSKEAGIVSTHTTIGGAWGDYNNDGYPDLFVSNGIGPSQLFRNNGDGTFTDVSRDSGVDGVCFGSVSVWCDYDNDGWLDLVQFIWSPENHVLYTLMHGEGPPDGFPMRIYHNNRNGTFTEVGRQLGIDGCWATMSGNVGDFDNDGHIDILLGNGSPSMSRTEPPVILENDGNGKFHNVSFSAGLPFSGKGHGANLADLAGDGRLCLLVAAGGSYPADLLTTSVLRPTTLPGNYLNVRLRGTKSNRSAIGARLFLTAGGRSQHRLMNGGTGFGSLPFEEHFGLGKLDRVESLEIRWPSGLRQQIANLPVNNTIRITEGEAGWKEVYPGRAQSAQSEPASTAAEKFRPASVAGRDAG
jgi:ASPIC/UnbV protein/VCBS repeat protein